MGRDAHTVGIWPEDFQRSGPASLAFEQTDGSPPPQNAEEQVELQAAAQAPPREAGIDIVDETRFRADADLRGKWVLRGEPALVESTSPRLGAKATYYSAVCLESGEVQHMEAGGNRTAETSAAFLVQMGSLFGRLAERTDEVKRRCRIRLQAKADALVPVPVDMLPQTDHTTPANRFSPKNVT
ncbi:MAG: hypothetical protein M0Z94_10540 [Dehalococcoidales bacterium]|nr:hypothetical protein [Dehalococcoidales bacterium]